MDRHLEVYELSRQCGPPRTNLRDADILDACGDASSATRPINHQVPEDVSREDLDFYGWVYAFMGYKDLLFYLYPIALEYEKDRGLDCVDAFMYSLDRLVADRSAKVSIGLVEGLKWIWDTGGDDYADWAQCKNLQKIIGVSV